MFACSHKSLFFYKNVSFLQTIGEQLGQVISIDNSEAYKAKLSGPRIRILVQDLNELPDTVEIPRLDGDGTLEYTLEFSGLPNQFGRCRSHEHQVRHCPKKESHIRRTENNHDNTALKSTRQLDRRDEDSIKPNPTSTGTESINPHRREEIKPWEDCAPTPVTCTPS